MRFVFAMSMASRDRELLVALQQLLGVGSIRSQAPRRAHWQPTCTLEVTSFSAHEAVTIPFFERYLPPTDKRAQFELWRDALRSYLRLHPSRYGKGASLCREQGCDLPVRGQGLCRKHYYRATGH